jgi:hypothetical protein
MSGAFKTKDYKEDLTKIEIDAKEIISVLETDYSNEESFNNFSWQGAEYSGFDTKNVIKMLLTSEKSKAAMLADVKWLIALGSQRGYDTRKIMQNTIDTTISTKLGELIIKYGLETVNTKASEMGKYKLSIQRIAAAFPVLVLKAHATHPRVLSVSPVTYWTSKGLSTAMMCPIAGAFVSLEILPTWLAWMKECNFILNGNKFQDDAWKRTVSIIGNQRANIYVIGMTSLEAAKKILALDKMATSTSFGSSMVTPIDDSAEFKARLKNT